MRVEWSEKALNEAESIVNYIFEENPIAALETDDLIRNRIVGKNAAGRKIRKGCRYKGIGYQ